jgi:hypothetical protein
LPGVWHPGQRRLAEDLDAAERELIRGDDAVAAFSQRSIRPYLAAWLRRVH